MAERTRGAIKRQRVAVVESSLANIDVVSQLAAFLEANDLCQVKATCKALGSAHHEAAVDGLSMAEEVARRAYESASDEEKEMLPRYGGESWIELYHHLLMLRARLTFDQFVGRYVEYRGGDKAAVQGQTGAEHLHSPGFSLAISGKHIMRSGKHWATFFTRSPSFDNNQTFGVIRPLPGRDMKGIVKFSLGSQECLRLLRREQTVRWNGDVHYCYSFLRNTLECYWCNWLKEGRAKKSIHWEGEDAYSRDCTELGMLLDLGNGTLSMYQNGRRLGTLKDGLAGEYCWFAGFGGGGHVSIQRGYDLNIV